jgi:SOS response regulatory protein OraA/RecX
LLYLLGGLDRATAGEISVDGARLDEMDENALALEAARKYVHKVRQLDWAGFRQKLGGFLGRRGFSYGVVGPVLRQLWSEIHGDAESYTLDDEDVI